MLCTTHTPTVVPNSRAQLVIRKIDSKIKRDDERERADTASVVTLRCRNREEIKDMEEAQEAASWQAEAAAASVVPSQTNPQQNRDTCQLCDVSQRRYTCPRCEIAYCSLACYRSEPHFECCQGFYKDCVENELKLRDRDPASKRRMMDILERTRVRDNELGDSLYRDFGDSDDERDPTRPVDSDDEEDIPDLAARLRSVDLNDADETWAALSESERQEFEATLRNGDAGNFIPRWTPWWSHAYRDKVVREIDNDGGAPEYVNECPKIIQVAALDELARASPLVASNLSNVLHAYAYTVLHCNGDHHNAARESVEIFLGLSDNMLRDTIYRDSVSAIEAVSKKIEESPYGDAEATAAMKNAVDRIIDGPEKSDPAFYVLAALSDLHELFSNVKKEFASDRKTSGDRVFGEKFFIGHGAPPKLTKKTLFLCVKKIEYYLSWVKRYGKIR